MKNNNIQYVTYEDGIEEVYTESDTIDDDTLIKYHNATFKTYEEAIAYKKESEIIYGCKSSELIIEVTSPIYSIPKGLIIETTEETEDSYVINPLYGVGNYVFLPKENCKKVC